MKIARRFYACRKSQEIRFIECTVTGNSTRAYANHPANVSIRYIVVDTDDKRAALRLEMTTDEAIQHANMLLSLAASAGGEFPGLKAYLSKVL